jgi:hypothetical protein
MLIFVLTYFSGFKAPRLLPTHIMIASDFHFQTLDSPKGCSDKVFYAFLNIAVESQEKPQRKQRLSVPKESFLRYLRRQLY